MSQFNYLGRGTLSRTTGKYANTPAQVSIVQGTLCWTIVKCAQFQSELQLSGELCAGQLLNMHTTHQSVNSPGRGTLCGTTATYLFYQSKFQLSQEQGFNCPGNPGRDNC